MNVIVFGANGGIGHNVVEQALAAGHAVTAVARRPESVTARHPKLTVKRGDVLDPASLAPLLAGQEVVVSAIGSHSRAPTVVYSDGVGNILQAMQPVGVRRLAVHLCHRPGPRPVPAALDRQTPAVAPLARDVHRPGLHGRMGQERLGGAAPLSKDVG
jgi:hypothetical protein